MSTLEPQTEVSASWQQVEDFLAKLHDTARQPQSADEFYSDLLAGCATTLAAVGGVVWRPDARGKWVVSSAIQLERFLDHADPQHQQLLREFSRTGQPCVHSAGVAGMIAECAVALGGVMPLGESAGARPAAILELFLRSGCSPAVQQAWQEFLATVCATAAEFHLHDELRTLRAEHTSHTAAIALVRRLQAVSTLQEVAFEIANEGCRYLNADRVSVLIRRGKRWQLLAASGVERIEPRADAVKQLQQLAAVTANWNDVIHYSQSQPNPALDDLPPRVADCLHRHIDQSHARSLVAVPLEFPTTKAHAACQAVLIAEHFGNLQELNPRQVVELAWLSSPALQQAKGLNSLPARALLGGSKWWSRLWENWGPSRLLLGLTGTALAVAALIYVPCDFEIEAPATLVPIVQQDIFATTSGTVRRVLVEHGERVEKGEAMAILADPQLALESERVRGEIETATKRLEAIAVARTDRQVREEPTGDGLPLSAEAQQLELRLASLQLQAKILRGRHEALTLRSPLAGMVLTLDVQHRLRSRPVERGQILFTVADDRSGWKLESRVPQDQIGHVLTAQDELGESLAVRFKLAGDAEQIYQGKLSKILETTVLDPQSLDAELPDVQVEVAVTDDSLPSAKPQMAARARFACGQRSLGYVWLHDAWDHIYAWLKF